MQSSFMPNDERRFAPRGAFGREAQPAALGAHVRTFSGNRWVEGAGYRPTFATEYYSRSFDRAGCEALIRAAAEQFHTATGRELPYNLAIHGPWVDLPRQGLLSSSVLGNQVAVAARTAGWLRAIADAPAKFPALIRILGAGSGRGVNSPRQIADVYQLAAHSPSPHRAERLARKAKARAYAITSRAMGAHVRWRDVAAVLEHGPRRVGKAAVVMAAASIGIFDGYGYPSYRQARAALIALHMAKSAHTADGVTVRHGEPVATVDGMAVYHGYQARDRGRVTPTTLVTRGNRSYHIDGHREEADAAATAADAWERQDRASMDSHAVSDFLMGRWGFTPIVYRSDSTAGGNCAPGTEKWINDRAWRRREWVPGPWLVPHLTDPRVMRVGQALAASHRAGQ